MRICTPLIPAAIAMAGLAFAQEILHPLGGWGAIIVYGKVQMEDGTPPPKSVVIERTCSDGQPGSNVGATDKLGRFTWRMDVDPSSTLRCNIKGVLAGYVSNVFEVPNLNAFSDPHLPPLVMTQKGSNSEIEVFSDEAHVPGAASFAWSRAIKAIGLNRLPEAERQLNLAVKAAPNFAQGWNALGLVLEHENKPAEALKHYSKAIALDPKLLGAYVPIARLSIAIKDWNGADRVADELIKRDSAGHYPEARMLQAMARFQLKNLDGAIASANSAIQLDAKLHKLPASEYILALSLDAKDDHPGASEHLKRYLAELPPRAPNAATVRELIDKLDESIASGEPSPLQAPAPETLVGGMELPSTGVPGEAWVPGGRKALAEIAGIEGIPSFNDFFTEYCRTLAREMTVGTSRGVPRYLETVRVYMATVSDLLPLGERNGDSTTITLSLAGEPQRKNTERVLELLGWKLVAKDGSFSVQLGDQPSDGPRQRIPRAFGIDEVGMAEALEAGRTFQFEIPSENARVVGGNDWSTILRDLPSIPGGIAGAFTLDARVAKTYAGIGSMTADAAAAVIRAVGMRNLVLNDSDVLFRYGESLTLDKTGVTVPGGAPAEPVWRKLIGVNPRDPAAFLRALMQKDDGRLAAFYYAIQSADEAHQRYFTGTDARTGRFYAWYRDSDEFRYGVSRHVPGWRTELLHKLPLDAEGNLHFPGGLPAWTKASTPDDEVLLGLKSLEALVPIAELEQRRASALDAASVALLASHYNEWKPLFPYFQKLGGLSAEEFKALEAFQTAVSKQPAARQNLLLGEWYPMLELIARGSVAGSLDSPAAARAFRRICEGMLKDDYSAQALAALREIAGGGNLAEAVASKLLRLNPERMGAFQRVLELQNISNGDLNATAPDPAKLVAALSGFVYAASVDPSALLISEDTGVVSRHYFAPLGFSEKRPFAFASAELVTSSSPPGSFFRGGFANFEKIAHSLANGGRSVPPIVLKAASGPSVPSTDNPLLGSAASGVAAQDVVFHANGRLVEAYATVTDSRSRYIDDLTQDQFTLIDQQESRPLVGFESHSAPVSVALLLDTTGSMSSALPALKAAALKLIGDLRPIDAVAVYSFSKSVTELQPFTNEVDRAKRAILSTTAFGETALYDALARVARDLSGRPGKKVVVVFTDGDDNSSTLTTDAAILRAKATGVPVYTIAEGEALTNAAYLKQLADVSKATGGESFAIKDSGEIGSVFAKVSEDLAHGYLLVFEPPPADDHAWRPITIQVKGAKGSKVRAREGYYPE